ncbi:MAG: nucleotidyltransferase domain-containing protein [Campylobacterota bacterium]|nr:nucleotidyltransferase domain-containing protein [Campylobacterota bacterium]
MKKRKYGQVRPLSIEELSKTFDSLSYIKTAFLFGSRSQGTQTSKSDYDFALELIPVNGAKWGMQAKAWMDICDLLTLKEYDVDIVDLSLADPHLKKEILDNYTLIKGNQNDISRLLR